MAAGNKPVAGVSTPLPVELLLQRVLPLARERVRDHEGHPSRRRQHARHQRPRQRPDRPSPSHRPPQLVCRFGSIRLTANTNPIAAKAISPA